MKTCAAILLSAMLASLGAEPVPAPAELRWHNGEMIAGELLDATTEVVRWKTPLFENPLELQWHVLRRIDQPKASQEEADPAGFSISLRDGSHLLGDLVEVTDTAIAISSKRHGTAWLNRSAVLNVRRLKGAGLILAGPVGDVGWAEPPVPDPRNGSAAPPAIPKLTTGPAGALMLPYWNTSASLAGALPEAVDVEFRVRSSVRPDFKLSLGGGSNRAALTLETWDDEIVLFMSDRFHFVRKLSDADRELSLRVCWDRNTGKCSVFTAAGEPITEWQTPEVEAKGSDSITLQNKGRDLALEFLRVRTRDGKPPPKIDLSQPRIEFADGTVAAGRVIRAAAGSVRVLMAGQSVEKDLPLASVEAFIFSADRPKAAEAEARLIHADGTFLTGSIAAIQEGAAMLKTSFCDKPLRSHLSGLRQMMLEVKTPAGIPPEKPFAEMDKLVVSESTLHGTMVPSKAGQPCWLPIGGTASVALTSRQAFEINRAFPPHAELPSAPALFYTRGGDVLPGRLRALDRSGVELESAILERTHLPAESLNAIQFGGGARMNLSGFTDSGWRVLKGDAKTVSRTGTSLTLEPGTALGHAALMQASEIQFSVPGQNYNTVRLRLFCAGADGMHSSNIILSHRGTQLYSGMESAEGQLGDQVRTSVQSSTPVIVRLAIQEHWVEMFLNGVSTQKFSIPSSKRAGSGLIIEPAGLWGNTPALISLDDFSARSVPGRTWLPDVQAETRMQTLTVPRFRQDDPPRHVLIAPNGDLLRGEIESATPSHFKFRSGLEILAVPRDRVKAAVWLKKPQESAPPAVVKTPAMQALDQRIERRMSYSSAELRTLISVLQREAPALQFKLPERKETRRVSFQFDGGQTIGEALERIGALFDLKHRIADDGSIVIESAPVIPKGLAIRSWWLKDDAFAVGSSAQEALASQGVAFPAGAAAIWQPKANRLTATHTVENLDKITKVLNAHFGGSFGSPTHWLLLTSGARLGLTINRFDEDFITGSHPAYGACKIPTPEVYTVRTTPPEPTMAIQSLDDWRLVPAPEPVLPETGGESSPALGQEAKPFKLPLLGGGDFDLSQEKGSIVVLDFWATWCAPCIKAMPELIDALSVFPSDRVKLIGVNQSEPDEQVKRFLETRAWKLTVAMDAGQQVARQYEVEGIPHTIVIGPDGKVAWVKTGYSAEAAQEAAAAIRKLLGK